MCVCVGHSQFVSYITELCTKHHSLVEIARDGIWAIRDAGSLSMRCAEWNTKWMHWKVRVDRFWIPHQIARLRVYTRLLHRTQDCFRLNEIVAHFVMHWFRACVSIPSIDYSMGCAPSEAIPTFSVRKIFTIIICRSDLARQTRELYITGWSE